MALCLVIMSLLPPQPTWWLQKRISCIAEVLKVKTHSSVVDGTPLSQSLAWGKADKRARERVDGDVERRCWNKMAVDWDHWCSGTSVSSKHSQSDLEAKTERAATMESNWRKRPSSWVSIRRSLYGSEHQKHEERQYGCAGRKHSWVKLIPPRLLGSEAYSPGPHRPWTTQNGFQSFSAATLGYLTIKNL